MDGTARAKSKFLRASLFLRGAQASKARRSWTLPSRDGQRRLSMAQIWRTQSDAAYILLYVSKMPNWNLKAYTGM